MQVRSNLIPLRGLGGAVGHRRSDRFREHQIVMVYFRTKALPYIKEER
jgi:hypothetical protein